MLFIDLARTHLVLNTHGVTKTLIEEIRVIKCISAKR